MTGPLFLFAGRSRATGSAARRFVGRLLAGRRRVGTGVESGSGPHAGLTAAMVDSGGPTPEDTVELRRELEEARDTLRAIRAGSFDALVIDTGSGDQLFTLSSAERPSQLLEIMSEGALSYFRAVAVDYDGTLAEGSGRARHAGGARRGARPRDPGDPGHRANHERAARRVPEVEDHVDAVVAENGAVLITPVGVRQLAAPVDRAVSTALSARGVVHRSGQVLLACPAADEPVALEVIRGLGLDCRLVRNRGELMILPAGVTKGSGLREALGDLGLSHHNTIGVGDAENDHSLLDVCEIGVAVANAVDAIRAHADVTLALPDGARGGRTAARAAARRARPRPSPPLAAHTGCRRARRAG